MNIPSFTSFKDSPYYKLGGMAATAFVVGIGTGVIASAFRLLLEDAARLRDRVIEFSWHFGPGGSLGFIMVVSACSLLAVAGAAMVHYWEPVAEGSGIPRVEAIVRGDVQPSRRLLLPVKFFGGLLAIGGGLALGREGPSVHMGGSVAVIISNAFKRNKEDLRLLIAAGAAAGLTTAFSAPLAGAVFVLEELVKKFEARMTVAVLAASGAAYIVVHFMLGNTLNFPIPPVSAPRIEDAPLVLVIGVLAGLFGVLYNAALMRGLRIVDSSRIPVEARAALIGACIGLVGWFQPGLIGGGDDLTENALLGHGTLEVVVLIFGIRFILAVVSYCALTPGGLFAPMLVLGAQIGAGVAIVANMISPGWGAQPGSFAIIGMAAFFAASVRAPVTGIVLATEMTGAVSLLPPLLGGCAIAMMIAEMMKSEPIYDALAKRSARSVAANKASRKARVMRAASEKLTDDETTDAHALARKLADTPIIRHLPISHGKGTWATAALPDPRKRNTAKDCDSTQSEEPRG